MKYLVLAFTLTFSMSGSVNADDHNTRWVLIQTWTHFNHRMQAVLQEPQDINRKTYQKESDCYTGLKDFAVDKNELSASIGLDFRYKIEIINDIVIKATKFIGDTFQQIHCVQIILD